MPRVKLPFMAAAKGSGRRLPGGGMRDAIYGGASVLGKAGRGATGHEKLVYGRKYAGRAAAGGGGLMAMNSMRGNSGRRSSARDGLAPHSSGGAMGMGPGMGGGMY